ncbi:HMA2 domain-containing protein [Clostridium tyrobutyricum]|uniref:HMA2 domain-containing protein n=1 Tax=Clostridium tyrobutyricum TaxID=1519 RepID=UPI002ED1C9D3
MPNFKRVLEVRHYFPGRLRLYVLLLKNNLELTELFKNQLKKIDSIEIKNINTTTGTILLNFKEKDMKPVIVIRIIIKLLGLEEKIGKKMNL